MLMKRLFLTTGMVVVAAAGYAAMTVVAPNSAAKIDSFVRNQGLGWNEDACRTNPVGCLTNRQDRLESLDREVGQSTRAIRSELERVSALVSEQEMLTTKNGAFLDQGRALYRERQGAPDQPIVFAGRTYRGPQFRGNSTA